jgi:predicted ribosome quality control (RQC) complex YloA/Tae2 family protein
MQHETIQQVVEELETTLLEHFVGRVFQLTSDSLAIDFGVRSSGYLFVSVAPSQPRIHLIKRTGRELEKQSDPLGHFAQALRSLIGGARLVSISKDESERVVRMRFAVENEIGERSSVTLAAQLTGRSANLFLLDGDDQIRHALRAPKGVGQQIGEHYLPPTTQLGKIADQQSTSFAFDPKVFPSISDALDAYYSRIEASQSFDKRAQTIRDRIKKEINQRKKLQRNLQRDLEQHGDPEQHKRLGDLLLANIATAVRSGSEVKIKDYYAEGTPEISLELDKDISLQDGAGRYFAQYTKAKRAAQEISVRLKKLEVELHELERQHTGIEQVIATNDLSALESYEADSGKPSLKARKKQEEKIPGVRRYLSSDSYEILVGRAALTNDRLTFKVARPHDLWLHAADYPGSHVVVRNPSRGDIPHRTIVEAAQLAAKFSQAGDDSKVTVNYTPRKFLAKPKGAAPGLVRMSSFRSVTVTPSESIPRL